MMTQVMLLNVVGDVAPDSKRENSDVTIVTDREHSRFETSLCVFFLMAYADEIDLHRAIVKVVPYRPKWAEHFHKERELLLKVMGDKALDIRHIGSTSIVGMPAKPILDILVGRRTLSAVEPFVEDLNLLGYEDRGSGDELGRRYFVKGAEEKRTHNLNFCELNARSGPVTYSFAITVKPRRRCKGICCI